MGKIKVIAHRGYSSHYPENTMLAFQRAVNVKADMIELDVTLTSDFVPIVIHDDTLKRTASVKGKVRNTPYATIQKLEAGSWFHRDYRGEKIPLLQDVLEFVANNPVELNIEIKSEAHDKRVSEKNIESQILPLLRNYRILNKTIISSFEPDILLRLRKLSENIKLGFIFDRKKGNIKDPFLFAKEIQAYSIHLHKRLIKKSIVERAKSENLQLYVFTLNKESDMEKMQKLGVNGMFTDYPERLQKLLSEK
ncbi:MAG: glycerophosphodiester phosphodiesterase [Leptospiraceae bacterium]|nr:glycerophosphodiester phosphodiesterase [Leptospiraceae bacterium]MCK6382562.1 glycerophosphodiester phosphodiesterase [Leptospiraceae bacterium]NUM41926.1 glycerophosphodiester phosphodiesterase [Leptospiraceae bacterium]